MLSPSLSAEDVGRGALTACEFNLYRFSKMKATMKMNATMKKFGYPGTCLKEPNQ